MSVDPQGLRAHESRMTDPEPSPAMHGGCLRRRRRREGRCDEVMVIGRFRMVGLWESECDGLTNHHGDLH